MAFPQLENASGMAVLSREADHFYCPPAPRLGSVIRVQATAATTGAALAQINHASTGFGPAINGHLVEIWTDADVVWGVEATGTDTIAAAGAFGTTSGATLKANERVQFMASNAFPFIFAVTAGGTANIEIRCVSAVNTGDIARGA